MAAGFYVIFPCKKDIGSNKKTALSARLKIFVFIILKKCPVSTMKRSAKFYSTGFLEKKFLGFSVIFHSFNIISSKRGFAQRSYSTGII